VNSRLPRNTPQILLLALMFVAAVVTLILVRHLTFFADSWEFLMNRRHLTVHAVFEPHNEHIVVLPVLITQLFLRVFGMTSAMPEYVLLTIFCVATAGLVFEYVRRRIGPWPALFAAALLLFLGPAFEVLLWTFEISYVGSMFFGLLMLLALEERTRRADIVACVALILCFSFSSLGIAFAVAGITSILVAPRETWRPRAFAVVIPIVLYGLWWIGWGHNAETHLTIQNIAASPTYVVEAAAVGVGALTGLGTNPSSFVVEPIWGRIFLVALVVGFIVLIRNRKRVDPVIWPIAVAAVFNWFLTAFNYIPGRDADVSRYQYLSAVLILLLVASLLRGTRISKRWLVVGGVLTALAILPNLAVLHKGREYLASETILTRSDTAALEIARPTVIPNFGFPPEVTGTGALINITAGQYFEAVDEFGSPAYSQAELETAQPQGRRQADIVLSHALPITAETEVGVEGDAGGCIAAGGAAGAAEVPLAGEEVFIEVPPGTEAQPQLRRFSEVGEFPVSLAKIPAESVMKVHIPADESKLPWNLHITSSRQVQVCGSPGA
jgi:hypothetical protein